MRKFTLKKFSFIAIALLFAGNTFSQTYPQVGLTMLPFDGATANTEISLILDVAASCPDSALLNADSVMMHSGVTIDENTWQSVVSFDQMAANGQSPKLIPFSPGAQVGNAAMTPVTVNDMVTVVMWPQWTAPAGALDDADSVMMHSGLTINGQTWQKVVAFDGVGGDGQRPKMTKIELYGKPAWIFTFIPADFYGVEDGDTVTAIDCVFNNGTWDAEGKDFAHDGSAADFHLQFSNGTPMKYSISFVPNDFYPIEDGQKISAINCVFNGGGWDKGEGKAHVELSTDCEDFMVPLEFEGINDKTAHSFKVYPNPVNNVLNISNLEDVNEIDISDISGKLVMSKSVESPQVSFNTSRLTNGMYIISYHTSNGILTSKFIKE